MELTGPNDRWTAILDSARRTLPLLGAVMHGSRIHKTARRGSDYDLLAVVSDRELIH